MKQALDKQGQKVRGEGRDRRTRAQINTGMLTVLDSFRITGQMCKVMEAT
jgi:hypothetical protein